MKPKKELVRVVRAPVKEDENGVQTGGEVSLDLTGRKPGRGACGVVILAADLSDKTKKNVRFEAEKYHVSVLEPAFTMEEISAAIGKKAGVLAVCDRGFAEKLKQLIADGEREEMRI